jgi:small subunit ribosomal protein S4
MRYTGPKNRIARREGMDLGLKTLGSKSHEKLMRKISIIPGQHGGARKRSKVSDYGRQIREKQKLRAMFGITDKQMKNYFLKATALEGNTAVVLSEMLEMRLDNVVYRLGFAPTRAAARQLVNHGHIKLNDHKNSTASTIVRVNDAITFSNESTSKIVYIADSLANSQTIIPAWLTRKDSSGIVGSRATIDDINKQLNMRLIVEFYSR